MTALRKIEELRERCRRRSWDELSQVRPEPRPDGLSPETQAQLHALGAAGGLSEPRRKWLLFRRWERVAAEARPTPEPIIVDWDAMRGRKVRD